MKTIQEIAAIRESMREKLNVRYGKPATDKYRKHVLICGGIGGGAKSALAEAGIELYGGVTGSADAAAAALAAGKLSYDPEAQCHDHEHAHGEGHACGHGGHSCH